jgi:DNA-binding MarR family transcriptional regulator
MTGPGELQMGHMTEIAVGGTAQTDRGLRLAFSARSAAVHGSTQLIANADLETIVLAIMAERRERYVLFGRHLFADPAWDILLFLTLADLRQRRMTVSQLCDGIDAPMTTALRWIANMTDQGLLVRRDDQTDKRRKFIELSPDALGKMTHYCSTAAIRHLLAA